MEVSLDKLKKARQLWYQGQTVGAIRKELDLHQNVTYAAFFVGYYLSEEELHERLKQVSFEMMSEEVDKIMEARC